MSRIHSGAIVSYLYAVAQIIVNLLYVPILIGGIGVSEYGLYQLIGSVISYMTLMNATFAAGTTRFYCKFLVEEDKVGMEKVLATSSRIYMVISVLSVGICIAAIAIVRIVYAEVLTRFQLFESALMLITLTVNLIVTMQNTISVAAITAHERIAFLKGTQLATVVLQPIAIGIIIQFVPYAFVVPCVQLFFNALCSLAQTMYRRMVLNARVVWHGFDWNLTRSLLFFSGGIILVLLSDLVFWRTNQLVLGFFFGTTIVAVYGVAAQVLTAYGSLGTAMSSLFMPRFTLLYSQDGSMDAISALFAKIGRISICILLLVFLGFAVFGRDFILLWAGDEFEGAYYVALVIMVPYTIDLAQNPGLTILQVMNRYSFRGKMYSCLALINIIVVILICPHYGLLGVAVCTSVMLFIGNVVIMNIYYHRVGINIFAYWKNAVAAAMPLVLYAGIYHVIASSAGIRFDAWAPLVLGVSLFTIGLSIVAYCFSVTSEDRAMIRGALKRLRLR